jgi:hypothetical protein
MAEIQEEKVRMSKVGEIMINVYRLDKGHKSEYDYRYPSELNNDHGNTVHEKTLKGEAKSHGIAYASPNLNFEVGTDMKLQAGRR